MSDTKHLLTRSQGYPLLALIDAGGTRVTREPVIGWCFCGAAMISYGNQGLYACVSDKPAGVEVWVDLPDVIDGIIARREWERDAFTRQVQMTVRSL